MDTMDHGSSMTMDNNQGTSVNNAGWKKRTKKKKKTFLLPEDQMDYYLSYEAMPIPRTLVHRDPAEGARLEKMRQEVIVELDRMRREYKATGRITYELEVTDDEQEQDKQIAVEQAAAAPVRPPIVVVGRSSRRRFRQGIVRRAGGDYEKIV
uniref:Uncharacterized protein n=1 Tax=Avena sativa TaxID=4498 RepID=A0ACD5ZAP6_AVESA